MSHPCSVEGCARDSRRLGMCSMHYYRTRKHGNPGTPGPSFEYHGMHGTKVYGTWHHMIERCENPKNISFPKYGAKGISVCGRWRDSFTDFLDDMGEPPTNQRQIDRIDSSGNYEPGNCRWATPTENLRNRRSVKLTMDKAREIRRMKSEGKSTREIAEVFNLVPGSVDNIIRGNRWKESDG